MNIIDTVGLCKIAGGTGNRIYYGERLPLEKENANVKKTSKGLIIGLIAAVVVVLVAVVLFVFKPWETNVATVGDYKVSKQEYLIFSKGNMSQFLSVNGITKTADQYEWNTTKVNDQTAKDQVKKSTLDTIQEIKIHIAKAKEAGITLDSNDIADIDKAFNDIITQSGSRQTAEQQVKAAYGVSLSEYKAIYKEIQLSQKYLTQERDKVKVSDDEVKKYYDDNKKEFDKVTATHILVSTLDSNQQPVSAGKKAEAEQKAKDLLARVQAGEDIKALAVEFSDDKPSVTDNKGEYTFGRGEMVTEFENWAFDDKRVAGESAIVETQFGYHVMQFQKRAETPLDDTLKATIKSTLINTKFNEEFTKKIDEWKKQAEFAIKEKSSITKIDKSLYGA